jgi:hypothetical protein
MQELLSNWEQLGVVISLIYNLVLTITHKNPK